MEVRRLPRPCPLLPPVWVFGITGLLAGCLGGDSTSPQPVGEVPLEMAVLAGGNQWVEPFRMAPERLEVLVRHTPSGLPARGVPVEWRLDGGDGALQQARETTDSLGFAWARLVLGAEPGTRTVEVRVPGLQGEPARFRVEAVPPPHLRDLPPGALQAGESVWIPVDDLGPEPGGARVTFSGIPAAVRDVRAGSEGAEVLVEVPGCLPPGPHAVRVLSRGILGPPTTVEVLGDGGGGLELAVGAHLWIDDPAGTRCVRLPGHSLGESSAQGEYLAVVQVTSPTANRRFGLALTALAHRAAANSAVGASASPSEGQVVELEGVPLPGGGSWVEGWKGELRAMEAEWLSQGSALAPAGGGLPVLPPVADRHLAEVPQVGSVREFKVLDPGSGFRVVEARAEVVGRRAVLYQDVEAPERGFTPAELEDFVTEFDEVIHPTVTEAFGTPSNLNGHGRVLILLTPQVNRLTPPGSDGFVGGFFFGLDLLPGRTGSNEGEVFYALVPDPQGEFGDDRDPALVRRVLPAILAHEFQHMIGFNQRVLMGGARVPESLWLSEALAQTAEDLVAEEHRRRGNDDVARLYEEGNWLRAARYLASPTSGALLAFQGAGTVAERGAGWLFLRYLQGRALTSDPSDLLRELTRSTLGGVANVVQVTGVEWAELFSGWSGALYLDGLGVPVAPEFSFPGVSLRTGVAQVSGLFPLRPAVTGGGDYRAQGTLPTGSAFFVRMIPRGEHGFSVNLAGLNGAPLAGEAGFRLLLVRLR